MYLKLLWDYLKLNGSNYLLWVQTFHIFIGAQNRLAHLLQSLPAAIDPTFATGFLMNIVITWFLNSLEVKISDSVMFLTTSKEM